MERRKLQNREAQRRYRENIKRKLRIAERQLENIHGPAEVAHDLDVSFLGTGSRSGDDQQALQALDLSPPTLDFDWTSLNITCQVQDGPGLLSTPESTSNHSSTSPSSGTTVIHIAAQKGYHKIVRILAESGVSVTVKDDTGQTPLHLAAIHGHFATITALTKAGAEVDARNDQGQTPLFVAVSHGQDACVRILLECGADPNARVSAAALEHDISAIHDGTVESFSL